MQHLGDFILLLRWIITHRTDSPLRLSFRSSHCCWHQPEITHTKKHTPTLFLIKNLQANVLTLKLYRIQYQKASTASVHSSFSFSSTVLFFLPTWTCFTLLKNNREGARAFGNSGQVKKDIQNVLWSLCYKKIGDKLKLGQQKKKKPFNDLRNHPKWGCLMMCKQCY